MLGNIYDMQTTVPRSVRLYGSHGDLVLTNQEREMVKFALAGLDGFYGGAGVHAEDTQRQLGHGAFPSRVVRTGRFMTLRGAFTFMDDRQRAIAARYLSSLSWDGELGRLIADYDGLELTSMVRLDGQPVVEHEGANVLKLELPLFAPDPFLYAPARRYQVFPAGAGEGLEYNLFTSAGAPVGENLAALSGAARSYGTVQTVDGVEHLTVDRRVNTSLPGSFLLTTVPVTAGKSYKITTTVSGDVEGTAYAVRTNVAPGSYQSSKYFVMDGTSVVVPAPVGEADTRTWVVSVPPGASRIDIFFFPLHPNGQTQAGAQTVSAQVWECTPTLGWGAGAPFSGAFANGGNADAHPVYTVYGSWPAGFRITTGSGAIEYPAPVHPSTPVRIDNRTGEVMVGGVDQTYRLTRRDWVTVPAGSAIQPRIEALAPSTGWMDVDIKDTYM